MQQTDEQIRAAYPDVDFTTNSMTKMLTAKMIKRTDSGMQIKLMHIFDKVRDNGECWNRRDMASPKTKASIDAIVKHIQRGGQVPAIEVQAREGGGVVKVDGYCRTEAYRILDASGIGDVWVSIVPFKGDELDALARIETSNHDSKLTPVEQLDLYLSIRAELVASGEKGTLSQIADRVGVSKQYVDQVLQLAKLDDEGKAMVESGKVKVADAIKAVRKSGGDAQAATKAIKQAAAPKPLMPSKPLMDDMYIGLGDLFHAMPKESKIAAQEFLKGDRKGTDMVQIPVGELAKLMALKAEGERQIEAAAERLAKKAKKEAQQEIPRDDLEQEEEPVKPLDEEPDLGEDTPDQANDDPDMSFL